MVWFISPLSRTWWQWWRSFLVRTIENVPLPVHSCTISNVTDTQFTVTCKDGSTRLSSSSLLQEKGKGVKTSPSDGSRMVQQEDTTTHHVMEIYDAFRESLVLTLTTTRNPSSSMSTSSIMEGGGGGQGTKSHKGQQDQILPSSSPPSGPSTTSMSSSSSLPPSSSSPFIIFKATGLERNTTYILVIYSQNLRGKSSNVVTTVLTKSSSPNRKSSSTNSQLSTDPKSSVAQNDEHGTDYFQEHYYQGNILLGPSSNEANGMKGDKTSSSSSDISMIERINGLKKSSASIFNRDIPAGKKFFETFWYIFVRIVYLPCLGYMVYSWKGK